MEEKTLFKIAIITSFIGLILMIVIAERIDVNDMKIKDVDKDLLGKNVRINGIIKNEKNLKEINLLNVSDDSGSITVVLSKGNGYDLKNGDNVKVTGFVKEYAGKLEIEADLVEKR